MHKMLSNDVFGLIQHIVTTRQNIVNDDKISSYQQYKNKMNNIIQQFKYKVDFEVEQILRLKYVTESLLKNYLQIKYIDIYIKYLKNKQKMFFRALLKYEENIKIILLNIKAQNCCFLNFFIQFIFEQVNKPKSSQKLIKALNKYDFLSTVKHMLEKVEFEKLNDSITFQIHSNNFNSVKKFSSFVLIMKYYFFNTQTMYYQNFVEDKQDDVHSNMQKLLLFFFQEKDFSISDDCLQIFLRIVKSLQVSKGDLSQLIENIQEQITDIVLSYDLWATKKFTYFLECLLKLELNEMFFGIFEQHCGLGLFSDLLKSKQKLQVLHALRIFDHYYSEKQKDPEGNLQGLDEVIQVLFKIQKKFKRQKNILHCSVRKIIKKYKFEEVSLFQQLIFQEIILQQRINWPKS